ncbi:hypothetical protein ACRRTK_012933 [Alexandromys fortis]
MKTSKIMTGQAASEVLLMVLNLFSEFTGDNKDREMREVKCKDCGAFGHASRSSRSPNKCGYDLLVPQPLKTRKEKENQDPCRLLGLPTPGTINQAERDKKQKQVTRQSSDERQGKALFTEFPMDSPRMEQDFNLVTSSVAHVSGQPLRMQFTRIFGDCWNSRFITAAPGLGIERETPPSACPASQENGEQTHSQVPWTVLYEDLQVSSSSEDSDGD